MPCGNKYKAVHWEHASNGHVPDIAVTAGWDKSDNIYVGRVGHDGDTVPGKIVPSHKVCYISYSGEEHGNPEYEVLCNPHDSHLDWVKSSEGDIPSGSLQGGVTIDGEPLYIGRVHHEGTLTVGKVQPSHNCLYIPYGGSEHRYENYEILVCTRLTLF